MKQLFVGLAIMIGLVSSAFAAEKSVPVAGAQMKVESALETKIRGIATMLRCPVCQGESVYDSNSDVAVEMKQLIGEKIQAGQSSEQILTYFKDRYGNFILMEPPAEGLHWVIWVFPLFMALFGGLLLFQKLRAGIKEEAVTGQAPSSRVENKEDLSAVNKIEELHL